MGRQFNFSIEACKMLHKSIHSLILLLLPHIISGKHLHQVEKRDVCQERESEREECNKRAYKTYMKSVLAGDDGRPHWLARKTCNYMTAAVEECTKTLIGHCNSEEDVTSMKDYQFQGILNQLASTVNEWDSAKCPAVKAHVDRQGLGIRIATNQERNNDLMQIADNTIFVIFSYAVASAMYLLT